MTRIYKILLGVGVFLILFSAVILMIGAHNHPPGEFLYQSKILEAAVANDPVQESLLREDHRTAVQRIMSIQKDTGLTLLVVFGSGVVVVFCGAYLRVEVQRAEWIREQMKQEAEQGGRGDGDKPPN